MSCSSYLIRIQEPMAYRHIIGLGKADSRSIPKTKPDRQYLRCYVILCVDYDVLYVQIGCVQSAITVSMSVSHAAAPSAWLDCIQPYLVCCVQTVRRLAAETFARQTFVHSHGVKRQPGKGKDKLENVLPNYLWFGLSVYPTWCGTVALWRVVTCWPHVLPLDWSTRAGEL